MRIRFAQASLAFAMVYLPTRSLAGETNDVHPIDLPTVLRLADAQNLDIQIARERLREAEANRESALTEFFPWIVPGAAYRRHDGRTQAVDGAMFDASKQSYDVGGRLNAQIAIGDALYHSLAAKQLVHAAGHAVDSERQDAVLAAVQAYFELNRAKAIVEVVKESLRISSEYQQQLHAAVGAGIAFKGDELRVQGQTENYRIAGQRAAEQERIAAARLAQILHLDPTVELDPESSDLTPAALVETNRALDSLVQQALSTRPELKQTDALIATAREQKNGAVYGPAVPVVGAQAFLGGLGGGKNGSTGNFSDSEDYGLAVGWRIGPGGLFDFGRIHVSEARLNITKLGAEKLKDEIMRQVVETHVRLDSLREQLSLARTNLETASETLRLTRERKEFGIGAVLEDIQAQQELTRARTDYLSTIAEYLKAQYALLRAIGKL